MGGKISRRRVLSAGAGTAVAGSLLPPSLRQAMAVQHRADAGAVAGRGGLGEIRHVVVLMQENRSFDHYFGTLRGVRGFDDRNAVELPSGATMFQQPGPLGAGAVWPFSVREAASAQEQDLQYIGALDHSWSGGGAAWHGGWSDRWVTAKTAATMAYYDRRDIPLQYELADTFTVCDAYHSSIHSSTSPNRNHLVSGWTGFEPVGGGRAVNNDCYAEDVHPGYTWTTYPERLEEAGHSWRVYQEWDNYTNNNLEFFARFKDVAKKALAEVAGARNMTAFYGRMTDADEAGRAHLTAQLAKGLATLSDGERSLFDRALHRGEPGTTADEFAADVAAGKLPEVSYLVPAEIDCEHPGGSSPVQSAHFVYKVLDALGRHPDVWRHTALFLTYDENDGFFDHVPPPVPAEGESEEERWQGSPTGLGMRVPMTVISPWSVGGYACSEVFDHTSIIRFLEKWTGVREPNISEWRRSVTGDLTSAFDFTRARRQPEAEQPGEVPEFTRRWSPRPPDRQRMPRQEPGRRPARPLPYGPDADGVLDADTGHFRLTLRNSGRAGTHFVLYPYAGEYDVPLHRDVAPRRRKQVRVRVPGDSYRFAVTGPNGFRREFEGSAAGPAAEAKVSSHIDPDRREIHLTVVNEGPRALRFTCEPVAYGEGGDAEPRVLRVESGSTRTFAHGTRAAEGWYDLVLTADEDDAFRRRLTGHIENGEESITG